MKKTILFSAIVVIACGFRGSAQSHWTPASARQWFNGRAWLGGLHMKPDPHINAVTFAGQYHRNRKYWEEAFAFLRDHDLAALPAGRYAIDSDHVFATVTDDSTKDFDQTRWESHRNYIDLQCVITEKEKMGRYPVARATVVRAYDPARDIANYDAPGEFFIVPAGSFMIFFPVDAHRPNITAGSRRVLEKKIVIKVQVAPPGD